MIIFLYGPDTYRSQQKLREAVERFKKIHKSGLNLVQLDMTESSFKEFKNIVDSVSMFGEKKLIILKNIFSKSDFGEPFLNYLEKSSLKDSQKEIVIIYEKGNPGGDKKLFEKLKKIAKTQEFQELDSYRLKQWVEREIKRKGGSIEPEALEKLIFFVGNNLWQMINEINKLISFQLKITEKNIDLLVKPKIDPDIFETIEAIGNRDKKTAIKLLHRHLEKGDSELYLLSMIVWQFRNLIKVKERLSQSYQFVNRDLGIHPYVVRKTIKLAKKFSLEELKKIYSKIFQVDLSIKTGRIEPKVALDLLISEIE